MVVNVSICLSPLYLLYCYQKTKPRPHKLLLKQVKFNIIEVKRVLFEIQFPFTVFLWFGSLNMLVPSDQLIKSNLISKFLTREQSMFSHFNISDKTQLPAKNVCVFLFFLLLLIIYWKSLNKNYSDIGKLQTKHWCANNIDWRHSSCEAATEKLVYFAVQTKHLGKSWKLIK